jgi:hypothetical protein
LRAVSHGRRLVCMVDHLDARQQREAATVLIAEAIDWLDDIDQPASLPEVEADIVDLLALRDRAGSVLLKIGVIGTFSSGKTFLINALQGHLAYSEDGNSRVRRNVRYYGLLPSSREPTTAAPTTLRPIASPEHSDKAARLLVRFMGDQPGQWTDAGEAFPARISAYVTDSQELLENRRPEHRGGDMRVAEVEVQIHDYQVDALFYDLPGVGSPNSAHDAIVRQNLQHADCFIFVTSAARTLAEADLEQIRELYSHHADRKGKPVLWVLSAIDLAHEIADNGEPSWRAIIRANNAYLERNFGQGRSGEGADKFLGRGFMGVSAAQEAEANHVQDHSKADYEELLAASRMGELRQRIDELIRGSGGRAHVNRLASEALAIVEKHARRIRERVEDAERPYAELEANLSQTEKQLAIIRNEAVATESALADELQARIRKVQRLFGNDSLALHLHRAFDAQIAGTNFRQDEELNKFEVEQIRLVHEWLEGDGGPQSIWAGEFEGYKRRASDLLNYVVGPELIELDECALDLNDLERNIALQPKRLDSDDTAQRVLDTAGKIMPLVSAVTVGAGSVLVASAGTVVTAGVALIPVGVALGVGGVKAMRDRSAREKSSMDVWRADEKAALDVKAKSVFDWYSLQMIRQGEMVRDAVRARIREKEDDMLIRIRRIDDQLRGESAREGKEETARLAARHAVIDEVVRSLSRIVVQTSK